jgi:UDP-N-acetylglucosamine 2-epimerase
VTPGTTAGQRLRVMTVVGTRPEIIRLSRCIAAFDRDFDHLLVHTGQNYDRQLSDVFFEDLGLRQPDHYLGAAAGTAAETVGNIITRTDALLRQHPVDAFVVLGDTNSCLAAYAAKRQKIPIFHLEAGNRCFDLRVPEEINRRLVDHLADVNLTYSAIAREYLLAEAFPADRVIKVGSPMREVLTHTRPKWERSDILARLKAKAGEYFVVSLHREENVDDPGQLERLAAILNGVAKGYGQRVIVSTHPRTRKRVEAAGLQWDTLVEFHEPFGFLDYVHLQVHARCTLSDSGTITEESSILGFPAVNVRNAHERPEGMEEAAVILAGTEPARVLQAVAMATAPAHHGPRAVHAPADYAPENVSDKVARIVQSYVDVVRWKVWGMR